MTTARNNHTASSWHSDLTFFTNEPPATLLDRFKSTLSHVQYFDVLVGYFRTSGFHQLYEALDSVEKIRILVGLSVDREAFEIIDTFQNQVRQIELGLLSNKQTKDIFSDHVADELENSEDSYETELGIRRFIEFLQSGKLQIKAHPSQKIHAKVYIQRFQQGFMDFGRVITGSSNFSFSGLVGNYEFNVELKNRADVEYAAHKFEELWTEAVDLADVYVDTIHRRTWLNDQIPPYQLYLKFLYEYFKEDINADEEIDVYLPDGFLDLSYQKQAVVAARKILDSYNGVFLADVVGLGKTYISALLAQQLPGRKLIICPPVLQDYWKETFFQFGIGGTKVESMGKLDHILADYRNNYDYIFIDEAHRFRNEGTQSYEKLHQICWGKKVILVSATPLNNTIEDIQSQLKLFQPLRKSTIPGVPNLERFFLERLRRLRMEEKGSPQYLETFKEVAAEVREQVLKYVMVRRTRNEIVNYFSDDMAQQGLSFPELSPPSRIIYQFDDNTNQIFNETITRLQGFSYARYTPLLYRKAKVSEFEAQSQRNVGAFMKGLLVKRLESSFFAFKQSLDRFIDSYNRFIAMYQDGTVFISKRLNVYDFLDSDNEAELWRHVEQGTVQAYPASDFTSDFLPALQHDLHLLAEVKELWRPVQHDPKLAQFALELKSNPTLKGQKAIIFTESYETGEYLARHLETHFTDQVLFYWSSGGYYRGNTISRPVARELIQENYDPRHHTQSGDVRLLVTTDVLAEGINLHRANIVINYDLPWNPTRVLQRVGRVNRVGTAHQQIHIFNFFPTAQADKHLGLENNIKAKIQAFHDMLGEDARYLTEEEDIGQFELFGDRLYRTLNRKESYLGEEEGERSELEYLQLIRNIRDRETALFETIKRLPKKARTGIGVNNSLHALLTFFRYGRLKKFFLALPEETSHELTFLDAVDLLECSPETPRHTIPATYYELITANKDAFAEAISPASSESLPGGSGQSNINYVLRYLRSIKNASQFTDDDEDYITRAINAFEMGIVPAKTSQRTKRALEKTTNPLSALAILKNNLPDALLYKTHPTDQKSRDPIEVILSAYLLPAD